MGNFVILPHSRRIPFIPLANPFETIIRGFTDEEASEVYEEEYFFYMMGRLLDGDPNVEIGASPELARQITIHTSVEPLCILMSEVTR